jgi:hypothetical protein
MRRLPGALALGLLAALLAHAFVYGDTHAMGGSYDAALQALGTTGAMGLTAFWLAICVASRGKFCQGSVLTAGIGALLPSLSATYAASLGWFWLAESVEGGHAWAPTGCILFALFLAAALTRLLATAALRALAKIAVLWDSGGFRKRAPFRIPVVERLIAGVPVVRALRLFSRPPPIRFSY